MTYEIRIAEQLPGKPRTFGPPIHCTDEADLRQKMREVGYHYIIDVGQIKARSPYPTDFRVGVHRTAFVFANSFAYPAPQNPAVEDAEYSIITD